MVGPIRGALLFGFVKVLSQHQCYCSTHSGAVAITMAFENTVQIEHIQQFYAQTLGQGAGVMLQTEADFADVSGRQHFTRQLQCFGVMELQYPCRIKGGQLHHVRSIVDLTRVKNRFAFRVKTETALRKHSGARSLKLFFATGYKNLTVRQ